MSPSDPPSSGRRSFLLQAAATGAAAAATTTAIAAAQPPAETTAAGSGTVGLQHASMALYNAWCDRVPVYLILGHSADRFGRPQPVAVDRIPQ